MPLRLESQSKKTCASLFITKFIFDKFEIKLSFFFFSFFFVLSEEKKLPYFKLVRAIWFYDAVAYIYLFIRLINNKFNELNLCLQEFKNTKDKIVSSSVASKIILKNKFQIITTYTIQNL
jgi:hypothetical protein